MLRFEGAGVGAVVDELIEVEDNGRWKEQAKERVVASSWLKKSFVPFK